MAAQEIRVGVDGKPSTLSFTDTDLTVARPGKKALVVPVRQLLWAELDAKDTLQLSLIARRKKALHLVNLSGHAPPDGVPAVRAWTAALMARAYAGITPSRRLRVLLNPHGGKGNVLPLYTKRVAPVFAAARCVVELTHTTHSGHARELAQALPLDAYDALVTVSGDGLPYECFNGLAAHARPRAALRIPLAPIPTGSGNGTSINILGLEQGFDVVAAALNAIKGRPMPLDLFSITQGGQRTFSYMTQCVGLMADLDIGTESFRWMGDTRFLLGFLRGIAQLRSCPVTLSMRVQETDKERMVAALSAPAVPPAEGEAAEDALPQPKYVGTTDEEGWTTFDKPLLYVYAGQAPYVGRDLMQFPVAQPNDGLIDIVAQELTTRGDMLKAMDGAETGRAFWSPSQHYFKASAYRLSPAPGSKGYVSVDGEAYEWKPFEVEVHPGLGTLMSVDGGFADKFDGARGKGKKGKKA